MSFLTNADLPEGVSEGLYSFGIAFEFIVFSFVFIIVILSLLKLRERGTLLNKYMVIICVGMDFALFFTAFGKFGVLFLGWAYELGTLFDNIALIFIFIVNCVFSIFILEMFTPLESKRKFLLLAIYVVFYLPAFIETFLNFFVIGLFANITHLLLSFFLYITMMVLVRRNLKDIEQKVHKMGVWFIFLTALFMLLFFVLTATSILLINFEILTPFNILYFISWVCMVLALFLFYTGFFLPNWVKTLFTE
jgi:hypothetical protein